MDDLNTLRKKIDELDEKIMKLLDERFTLNKIVGIVKQESKIAVNDTTREQFILNKTKNYKYTNKIQPVYLTIFEESKKLQGK
jgi:chorismate mutase